MCAYHPRIDPSSLPYFQSILVQSVTDIRLVEECLLDCKMYILLTTVSPFDRAIEKSNQTNKSRETQQSE